MKRLLLAMTALAAAAMAMPVFAADNPSGATTGTTTQNSAPGGAGVTTKGTKVSPLPAPDSSTPGGAATGSTATPPPPTTSYEKVPPAAGSEVSPVPAPDESTRSGQRKGNQEMNSSGSTDTHSGGSK